MSSVSQTIAAHQSVAVMDLTFEMRWLRASGDFKKPVGRTNSRASVICIIIALYAHQYYGYQILQLEKVYIKATDPWYRKLNIY